MHNPTYVVTGTVTDEKTVKLDEALPPHLTPHLAKVRVTIEPLGLSRSNRYVEVMQEIRQRQKARKHQPPSPEEIEEYLRQERGSWE